MPDKQSPEAIEEIVDRMTSTADALRGKLELFWRDTLSLMQLLGFALPLKDSDADAECGKSLEEVERGVILDALERHHWHVVSAANAIGVPKTTMYRRIREFNLQRRSMRRSMICPSVRGRTRRAGP